MSEQTLYPITDSIISQDSFNKNIDVAKKDSNKYGFENSSIIPVRSYENVEPEKDTFIIQQLFTPVIKPQPITAWQTIILIFSVLLLGLAKAFSMNRFQQSYKSLFN